MDLKRNSPVWAADTKKNVQDGGNNGKPWPKGSRRSKESPGPCAPKTDVVRKSNNGQQLRNKRPKPRGGQRHPGAQGGGNEIAGVAGGHDAEIGSVFMRGRKKQNCVELLNFNYGPREGSNLATSKARAGRNHHRWLPTKHKYNKEEFLQATCQFIVKSTGDYRQYSCSPDILVDWDLIEQVNIHVSDYLACPICLYPPTAAKMTKCGHVYCWPCILHYLALSDHAWRKCPICYESIHKKDLKSAISISHPLYNVNDTVTFKLMKRKRNSFTVYPFDFNITKDNLHVSDSEAKTIFSKLLLANKQDVMDIIDRERTQLEVLLAEDPDSPEKCFIEESLGLLSAREKSLFDDDLNGIKEEDEEKEGSVGKRTDSTCSDETVDNDDCSGAGAPKKYFYFYQASDGQHIYLHPMNCRMLEDTYGSLDSAPKEIKGKVLEKDVYSMTEELRSRYCFLQHLPIYCQFEFAEIQLRQPVVSKETVRNFEEQIESRKKRRQNRAREEKQRAKRIIAEEDRIMGKIPEAQLRLESTEDFPEFSEAMARIEAELASSPSNRSSISDYIPSTSCSSRATVGSPEEHPGISFAKMLSTAKKPEKVAWPELKPTPAVPVTRLINVTGSKAPSVFRAKEKPDSDSDENEDYVQAPRANATLSDVVTVALENASINKDDGGKKKKKKKETLLFSTRRGYL